GFREVIASRRSPTIPNWLMTGDWRLATVLRFFRLLAGQSLFGRFEFLLLAGKELGVHFGRDRLVPLCDGTLPVSDRQFQPPGFLVDIAQVIVHGRIGTNALRSLYQLFFCLVIFAEAK